MRILLAFIILIWAIPVGAQTAQQELMSVLSQAHTDPKLIKLFEKTGFKGERLEIVLEHVQKAFANKAVRSYVAQKLMSSLGGSRDASDLSAVLLEIQSRGIVHLSPADLVYMMRYEVGVLKAMPPSMCGRVIKEKLTLQQETKARALITPRISPDTLRQYYRIVRKAIIRGSKNPEPPEFSYVETDRLVEKVIGKLDNRVEVLSNSKQISRAVTDKGSASNATACQMGILMIESILDVSGRDRHRAIQLFLSL